MAEFDCRYCGELIEGNPARCPYCWLRLCNVGTRDCEPRHINRDHPRAKEHRA